MIMPNFNFSSYRLIHYFEKGAKFPFYLSQDLDDATLLEFVIKEIKVIKTETQDQLLFKYKYEEKKVIGRQQTESFGLSCAKQF